MKLRRTIGLAVACVMFVACGGGDTEKAEQVTGSVLATGTTAVISGSSANTPLPATQAPQSTAAIPTRTATVTATTIAAQPLRLVAQGYGTTPGSTPVVGWAAVVENTNPGHAAESVQFQIAAYDAAGTVLKTDTSSMPVVWPGEKTATAGRMYLSQGQEAARVDIQMRVTRFVAAEPRPFFSTEGVTFRPDRNFPKVVGVVRSPYTRDLQNLRVSVVGYDAEGQIVGGGFTFMDFVPAGGTAAVEVSWDGQSSPTRVEIYPSISNLTLLNN